MGDIASEVAMTIKDVTSTSSAQILPPLLHLHPPYTKETRDRYLNRCLPLYIAALKGDWRAAETIIEKYPDVIRARITEGWETALHISAAARHIHFVEKLVGRMSPQDLEIQNKRGNTALSFAAANGSVRVAEVMVARNGRLPKLCSSDGVSPLYMAALLGHRDMVKYLLPLSEVGTWTELERARLLTTCIASCLFDIALFVIEDDPKLVVAQDQNGETALHVLARMPSAFDERTGTWRRITNYFQGVKEAHDRNLMRTPALELVKRLLDHILQQNDLGTSKLIGAVPQLLFTAAKLGNTDFLIELVRYFPDLIWKVDNKNRSIFHIAILKRHWSIFNLLHEIGSVKTLLATYRDIDDNNMLHLAATLAPPSNVAGPALHLQQEVLWFKEVETVVQPSYREMKNKEGETPQALFSKNHKELMMEGEKWMKGIAKSSSVVAALVATVVFATAFTIPGANHDNPWSLNFPKWKFFRVFSISSGVALFSSSTSIAMFISIITSRYAEDDFLNSLPLSLMLGLTTLFISIAAMIVAFFIIFLLPCNHGLVWVYFLLSLLAGVPIVNVSLKHPLVVDIIRSRYGPRRWVQSPKYLFK